MALRLLMTAGLAAVRRDVPIVAVFQSPTLTKEAYQNSVLKLTNGARNRMESVDDWPVNGMLMHVAGETSSGFRVVDVWESEEAMAAFGATLMPILGSFGVEVTPDVYPAFAFVSA